MALVVFASVSRSNASILLSFFVHRFFFSFCLHNYIINYNIRSYILYLLEFWY